MSSGRFAIATHALALLSLERIRVARGREAL